MPGSRTSEYEYDLPPDRIAQFPSERREESRLLVLNRETGAVEHRRFADLVEIVPAGDLLVLNETKVFPARLRGTRAGGGEAEVLLLRPHDSLDNGWTALVRPGAKLKPGREVEISPLLRIEIVDVLPGGERIVQLRTELPQLEAIERYGEVPLPPYVRRPPTEADRRRYQTVYARDPGSVAAPTAGLHFTDELLARLEERGVRTCRIVLHVGLGTFRPVEVDDPAEHRMHSEWYRVPGPAAAAINRTRDEGGAVWAIGTTTVRTLETVADGEGRVHPGEGWTDIFIRPPHVFRAVDRMITNFHLPRSTLLMLVAAFAGYDATMSAYREAVRAGYRFYSFGDAMAIV